MRRVLLYSGGMDSWLIDKLWKPDIRVFFDIGTANSNWELERVKKEPNVKIIKLPLAQFEQRDNNYFLPLRNLHFVTYGAHFGDVICLGATGSSTHKDKNDTFAVLSETVINYLLAEQIGATPVKVVLPYRNVTKTELLAQYLSMGGDIDKCYNETFSCYSPSVDGTPCMKCNSCLSKFTAFYNNGYKFNKDSIIKFVENVFAPNSCAKPDSVELALKLKYGNKTICIDFDNTITEISQYPVTGKLRPEVRNILCDLKSTGYRLLLFTSRIGIDFINAVNLCKMWELPFDDYISGKPYSAYYIDDKLTTLDKLRKDVLL